MSESHASYAMIMLDGEWLKLPISPLETARLVAHDRGYYDVDVQPFPDHVRIVCRGNETSAGGRTTFTAKGATVLEACDAVVRRLW